MNAHDRVKELSALADRWQQVKQGTLTYGVGTVEQQAADFQFNEILPKLVANTLAHWEDLRPRPPRPDILITMSGFSPETTMISFSVLKPKYLFVVTSSKADKGIDRIHDFVMAGPDKILPSRLQWLRCHPTDPYDIYSKVKNILKEHNLLAERELLGGGGEPLNAIVDITGGKKVMSAAAALLAWRLSVPLCYIDSEFDEKTRRPKLGSERLIYLNSPVAIYGEEEINIATEVFNSGHYAQARVQFAALAERIQEPIFACFMAELSALYGAWCDLEIPALKRAADRLEKRLADTRVRSRLRTATPDLENRLLDQLEFIRLVVAGQRPSLLLCFYLLGQYYGEHMNRYDFAALLFHRTMEGALEQRLEDLFPGLTSARDPDYSKIDRDPQELLDRYNALIPAARDAPPATQLPPRLMFMPLAKLLLAVGDSALVHDKKHLGHLQNLAELRNQSVLAHGFTSISKESSNKLKVAAQKMLDGLFEAFDHAMPSGKKLIGHCESLRFVQFRVG